VSSSFGERNFGVARTRISLTRHTAFLFVARVLLVRFDSSYKLWSVTTLFDVKNSWLGLKQLRAYIRKTLRHWKIRCRYLTTIRQSGRRHLSHGLTRPKSSRRRFIRTVIADGTFEEDFKAKWPLWILARGSNASAMAPLIWIKQTTAFRYRWKRISRFVYYIKTSFPFTYHTWARKSTIRRLVVIRV